MFWNLGLFKRILVLWIPPIKKQKIKNNSNTEQILQTILIDKLSYNILK